MSLENTLREMLSEGSEIKPSPNQTPGSIRKARIKSTLHAEEKPSPTRTPNPKPPTDPNIQTHNQKGLKEFYKARLEGALLSEMPMTPERRNETELAAKRLEGFSTHSALPAKARAEHAAKLNILKKRIEKEKRSKRTYGLGGRIVGPGGKLGRRPAGGDPAQSGPVGIASDSGRLNAAARMPFGMR